MSDSIVALIVAVPMFFAGVFAFSRGYSMAQRQTARRVMLERERCARLALAVRPDAETVAERRVALYHGRCIHAAILRQDTPVRRTAVTT